MPVSALQVLTAVFTRTPGSDAGSGPSKLGLHGPPIAKNSLLRVPTKKLNNLDGCAEVGEGESSSGEVDFPSE
uniref:Uncharacterized protein n=1 Tax=Panstrongylus lignarius TaxID=156445 RepID=A0A224Y609_9HEMI